MSADILDELELMRFTRIDPTRENAILKRAKDEIGRLRGEVPSWIATWMADREILPDDDGDGISEGALVEALNNHERELLNAIPKAPAAVPAGEAVALYQLRKADGSWIDQSRSSYDYNMANGHAADLRIVYTTPPAPVQAAPQEGEVPQLVRYGRCSAESPYLLDQRDDGYWTPWHVAQRELARALAANPSACELGAVRERVAKMIYEQWTERAGYVPWVDGGNSIMQDGARSLADAALQHRGDSQEVGRG